MSFQKPKPARCKKAAIQCSRWRSSTIFGWYSRVTIEQAWHGLAKATQFCVAGAFPFCKDRTHNGPFLNRSLFRSSLMAVPALPLVELCGCLGRWAKTGAKKNNKYHCVIQKVTNVHQVKVNKHDESEGNTRSRSLWKDKCVTIILLCCIMVNNFLSVSISYIQY